MYLKYYVSFSRDFAGYKIIKTLNHNYLVIFIREHKQSDLNDNSLIARVIY